MNGLVGLEIRKVGIRWIPEAAWLTYVFFSSANSEDVHGERNNMRKRVQTLEPDYQGSNPDSASSWLNVCMLSCFSHVQLFATPWTVACQVLLSMGFSRQEYWSGLSFLTPGYLPDPGVEPSSLTSPALAGGFFTTSAIREAPPGWMATCKLLNSLWLGILFYSKGVKNWTYLMESSEAEMS